MKKLQFAIIGTGYRGTYCWGDMIHKRDDTEVIALCDPNPVRMKKSAEIIGIKPKMYKTTDELFKHEKPDAVIITSPDGCHEANAVAALNAGVNVLIDKPLSTTVAGCRHIIAASEKAKKIIMIGFNLRHHAVLRKMKELIDAGTIGRIFFMENREFYSGGRTYMSRWNRSYEKCGGLWIHKGCHDFDIFNWFMNFPKPVKVSAFAGISVLTPKNIPFKLRKGVKPGPCCHNCAY